MRMVDKVAIVTGAGRGIGRATALRFAREGASVVVASQSLDNAQRTATLVETEGHSALPIAVDVTRAEDVQRMIHTVRDIYGHIDVLVNNAGVFRAGNAVNTTEEDWHRIMNVNLCGAWLCMKYTLPEMIRSGGGSIVNVSSEAGLIGIKDMAAYSSSKGGLIALTRSTALEYVGNNIRVNCVCPGRTATDMVEQHIAESPDPIAARRELSADRPMLRMGTVDEIANAILFLASDEASFATGVILPVDGGISV